MPAPVPTEIEESTDIIQIVQNILDTGDKDYQDGITAEHESQEVPCTMSNKEEIVR